MLVPKENRFHGVPNTGQVPTFTQNISQVFLTGNMINVDDTGCHCPSHSIVR